MSRIRAIANSTSPEPLRVIHAPHPPAPRGTTPSGWGRRKLSGSALLSL